MVKKSDAILTNPLNYHKKLEHDKITTYESSMGLTLLLLKLLLLKQPISHYQHLASGKLLTVLKSHQVVQVKR